MGSIRSRKGKTSKNKSLRKSWRTRNRTRDLDLIAQDLSSADRVKKLTEFQEDLPGGGQFYCVHCSRYFTGEEALEKHFRSKNHKKRVKTLEKNAPYTAEEAEWAGGVMPPSFDPSSTRKEPSSSTTSFTTAEHVKDKLEFHPASIGVPESLKHMEKPTLEKY